MPLEWLRVVRNLAVVSGVPTASRSRLGWRVEATNRVRLLAYLHQLLVVRGRLKAVIGDHDVEAGRLLGDRVRVLLFLMRLLLLDDIVIGGRRLVVVVELVT